MFKKRTVFTPTIDEDDDGPVPMDLSETNLPSSTQGNFKGSNVAYSSQPVPDAQTFTSNSGFVAPLVPQPQARQQWFT